MGLFVYGKDAKVLAKAQESLEQIAEAMSAQNVTPNATNTLQSHEIVASMSRIADVIEVANTQEVQNAEPEFSQEWKKRVAFALNLCTVSVSQIVDYDDIFILEQEYEAILNNLNLEEIPKDEALLNILKQLLETITFFRIQEGDKALLNRRYEHQLKNAIWSAMPNPATLLGLASGNVLGSIASLVLGVGTGYMNYRRNKADLQITQEEEMWKLQRSAMEQFNGLRRELFDTAWRLADKYNFPDQYRLTERQIFQYNQILLDNDDLRRYERLKYIEHHFKAYPVFYYYLGHAANAVAQGNYLDSPNLCTQYKQRAKESFSRFMNETEKHLLREDQILATCILEYFDLLLLDNDASQDELCTLIEKAVAAAGTAYDILQICAFSYIKIGKYQEATSLLRMLINEEYNTVQNGQLLSGIYLSEYLVSQNEDIRNNYSTMRKRIRPELESWRNVAAHRVTSEQLLLPFPAQNDDISNQSAIREEILGKFIVTQKELLLADYSNVLCEIGKHYTIRYNQLMPISSKSVYLDRYYLDTTEGFGWRKEKLTQHLNSQSPESLPKAIASIQQSMPQADTIFKLLNEYTHVLNCLVEPLCRCTITDTMTNTITSKRNKINQFFAFSSENEPSLNSVIDAVFGLPFIELGLASIILVRNEIVQHVDACTTMQSIANVNAHLSEFYDFMTRLQTQSEEREDTPLRYGFINNRHQATPSQEEIELLSLTLLGEDGVALQTQKNLAAEMLAIFNQHSDLILKEKLDNIDIYRNTERKFSDYIGRHSNDLSNYVLNPTECIFAIINDTFVSDVDLLFTTRGIRIYKRFSSEDNSSNFKNFMNAVTCKKILSLPNSYSSVLLVGEKKMTINSHAYNNKNINKDAFLNLCGELFDKVPHQKKQNSVRETRYNLLDHVKYLAMIQHLKKIQLMPPQ